MTYKEALDAFKASCRVYQQEKKNLDKLKQQKGKQDELLIHFLEEDIVFVEGIMDQIAATCGTNARVLAWQLFVEEHTQAAIAEQYKITRRQLQYSMDKWLHAVLTYEDEN